MQIDQAQLDAMQPWLHDFALPAPLRVPMDDSLRARIRQRRDFIVPRIAAQYPGGRLDGLRVLDLGANAGFWAREMARLGASATCVEPKVHNITQAELIAKAIGAAGINWIMTSAEEFLSKERVSFDIVLCLGLLYHAADSYSLLRACAQACGDLLVVDSQCINDDASYVEFRREYAELPSQGTSTMVTVPSRGGVYRMMQTTGFAHLMEAGNQGDLPPDYLSHTRVLMLARDERPLTRLSPADRIDSELESVYPKLIAQGDLARAAARARGNERTVE